MIIKSIRIDRLFGRYSYNFVVRDNRLVLVSENGSGKSTILNILFSFLSCNWLRLADFEFYSLEVDLEMNGKPHSLYVERHDCLPLFESKTTSLNEHFPPSVLRDLERTITRARREFIDRKIEPTPERLLDRVSIDTPIPRQLVRTFLQTYYFPEFKGQDTPATKESQNRIRDAERVLLNASAPRIVSLPTYRRIERAFREIFSREDDASEQFAKFDNRLRSQQRVQRSRGVAPLELRNFGMRDVDDMITNNMTSLDTAWTSQIAALTASNFQQVLRKEYRRNRKRAGEFAETEKVLARVGGIFSDNDKELVRHVVLKRESSERLSDHDKIVLYFLRRLTELYIDQTQREQKVVQFTTIVNDYLTNKRFIFDPHAFTLNLYPVDQAAEPQAQLNMELSRLSSGEKQIVSLFAHLLLSDVRHNFILFDEPELSLSIKWQKRLLPDILSTGRCFGLISATHSPFIFDNSLESYTHSLREFGALGD